MCRNIKRVGSIFQNSKFKTWVYRNECTFQLFSDLKSSAISRYSVHCSHHSLFDHFTADFAGENFGDDVPFRLVFGAFSFNLFRRRKSAIKIRCSLRLSYELPAQRRYYKRLEVSQQELN